jgi:hypothetical protein
VTAFILSPDGDVHGDETPCDAARTAIAAKAKNMVVRPGHVLVYKLHHCTGGCWTDLTWTAFMTPKTLAGAR